jgi:hypothetical protein
MFWDRLTLAPFIFFGLAIPAQLIWINSIRYKFYSEWTTLVKDYPDKLELKKGLKIYIKNFWPWAELVKLKNTVRAFDMPYYDFDKADILESKDLIIIYGQSDQFSGLLKPRTRPFGINLTDKKIADHSLYQVNLISINETNEFRELTIVDHVIGADNPITIRIYNK